MDLRRGRKLKTRISKSVVLMSLLVAGFSALFAEPSWDSEKLALEVAMQQRVEAALSKILPDGSYVVVIQIEPIKRQGEEPKKEEEPTGDTFFLPGVPAKKN